MGGDVVPAVRLQTAGKQVTQTLGRHLPAIRSAAGCTSASALVSVADHLGEGQVVRAGRKVRPTHARAAQMR